MQQPRTSRGAVATERDPELTFIKSTRTKRGRYVERDFFDSEIDEGDDTCRAGLEAMASLLDAVTRLDEIKRYEGEWLWFNTRLNRPGF